jgi:hypothetical protein
MQIELYCPRCRFGFFSADSPVGEALDRLAAEGPWSALGDGETLEDRISAVLSDQDAICCPECGRAATVREESLGRVSRELLANW